MKKGWQLKTLGDVCERITQGPNPKYDKKEDDNFRVLKTKDLYDDAIHYGSADRISKDVFSLHVRAELKPGDVLLAIVGQGSINKCNVFEGYARNRFIFTRALGLLRPNIALVNHYFLKHFLQSSVGKEMIDSGIGGTSGQQVVTTTHLKRLRIPVPPLLEQERIVKVLDEAFASLATAKAHAEKNLQNARALFESHLQSVFTRRGSGWVEKTLEEVVDKDCTLSYGIVQPGNEYPNGLPVVRPTDLIAKVVAVDGLKLIDPKLAAGYRRTTLRGGELLLCVRGSTGVVSTTVAELAGANVTRGIVPIVFDPSMLCQDFAYFLMTSDAVQSQIRAKTYGTALMQINIGDLRKLTVSFPPLVEQKSMSVKLNQLSTETQRLETLYKQKLAALAELKKSLLHQAFSGAL